MAQTPMISWGESEVLRIVEKPDSWTQLVWVFAIANENGNIKVGGKKWQYKGGCRLEDGGGEMGGGRHPVSHQNPPCQQPKLHPSLSFFETEDMEVFFLLWARKYHDIMGDISVAVYIEGRYLFRSNFFCRGWMRHGMYLLCKMSDTRDILIVINWIGEHKTFQCELTIETRPNFPLAISGYLEFRTDWLT